MRQKLFSLVLVLILLFFKGCGWNHLMSKDSYKEVPRRNLTSSVPDKSLAVYNVKHIDFDNATSTKPVKSTSSVIDNPQTKQPKVLQVSAKLNKEPAKFTKVPVYRVLDEHGNVIYVF